MRAGTTSLRSAKPTWHQKGRPTPASGAAGSASPAGAGGATMAPRGSTSAQNELSSPTSQRIIVFMAGGMTYSEMRTAYQIGKRVNADVYMGT